MATKNSTDFQVTGNNHNALFIIKAYLGDGMLLLAMNWKNGKPPKDLVGFSIEYKEPGGEKFFALKNRLSFLDDKGKVSKESISSLQAPFQMFRWVHFPRNANLEGNFSYHETNHSQFKKDSHGETCKITAFCKKISEKKYRK